MKLLHIPRPPDKYKKTWPICQVRVGYIFRENRPIIYADISQVAPCVITQANTSLLLLLASWIPIIDTHINLGTAGRRLNIKKSSYQYKDSRYKDKTVVRPSYLYNGNSYAVKTILLYWDGPLIAYAHYQDMVTLFALLTIYKGCASVNITHRLDVIMTLLPRFVSILLLVARGQLWHHVRPT